MFLMDHFVHGTVSVTRRRGGSPGMPFIIKNK